MLASKVLRPNTRSQSISELQDALRFLGFSISDPEGFFGKTTAIAVQRFQRANGLNEGDGTADLRTLEAVIAQRGQDSARIRIVRGRVTDEMGQPIRGMLVEALSITLDKNHLLGREATDARGDYRIQYGGDEAVDLQLQLRRTQRGKVLVSSPLILAALPDEVINLTTAEGTPRGVDEFAQVDEMVRTVVGEDATVDAREDRALLLLARRTGLTRMQVENHAMAQSLAAETGLEPAIYYGLLRTGAPRDPKRLLKENTDVLVKRLVAASRSNLVSAKFEGETEAVAEALDKAAVARQLTPDDTDADVGALLHLSRLTRDQQTRVLTEIRRHRGETADLWTALRADSNLSEEAVDEAQLLIQLGGVTLNHPPMVRVVREALDPADASDLAGLDQQAWEDLLEGIDPPAEFLTAENGRRPAARKAYAKAIDTVIAKAFPTSRLFARWSENSDLHSDDIERFAADNPGFEFRDTSIAAFLRDTPDALRGAANPDQLRQDLDAMHRVFSLVPADDKFPAAATLWRADLRSAHAIVHLGSTAFRDLVAPDVAEDDAELIFANARKKTAVSMAMLVQYSPLFQGMNAGVMGNLTIADPPDVIPNWSTLFGSLDFCQCRHCRSILSPAAYFVDLLQFLQTASRGEENGLEALLGRHRPDLAHIRLDCDNTNTPIPYIDLVNEVLENAVLNSVFALDDGRGLQTEAPAKEIAANPEHIRIDAYDELAAATFPWSMPFNLWHEERRVYLGHMDIESWELMDTFHREGDDPAPIDRAAAYLGLTRLQRRLITGEEDADHGLGASDGVLSILQRGGMTLDELQALLQSRFVNPEGVEIEFEPGSCDLETATLALNGPARDRLHRFRRLELVLKWSVFDLDQTIDILGGGALDADLLIEIAALARIAKHTKTPVAELLAIWARQIPNRAPPHGRSLYAEHFLNPGFANPLAPVTEVFGLNGAGNALTTTRPLLDAQGALAAELSPLLGGGLSLSEPDLRLLIDRALPTTDLTLDNLSQLYRLAAFARAANMTVAQYLSLVELGGGWGIAVLDPASGTFQPARPNETWEWMSLRARLLAPGFSIEDTEWLLANRQNQVFRTKILRTKVGATLQKLQSELSKMRPVSADTLADPSPAVIEDIDKWLSAKLPLLTEDTDAIMRILIGQSTLTDPEQAALLDAELGAVTTAATLLLETPGPERIIALYRDLAAHFSRDLVVQHLAATVSLDVAVLDDLLSNVLLDPAGSGRPAIAVFMTEDFVDQVLETPDEPPSAPAAILLLLEKLALVVQRLDIPSVELAPLILQAEERSWLDLRTLPVTSEGDSVDLSAWLALIEAMNVRRLALPRDVSLFDVFSVVEAPDATREALVDFLSEHTGWDTESLAFLTGPEGYAFSFPADFQSADWVLTLHEAFELVARSRASGAQLWSWNLTEADAPLALRIKAAAKARHSVQSWLSVAPPLADSLRRLRRTHMVDLLIARHSDIDSVDDLYEQLLIDPQMEPCFLTSRIKQAISSVQLFVQRVFLGLEPTVRFGDVQRAEWQWRKHYRYRQAALTAFIFPENFVQPELRADKSPLFAQLEQNLLQEEVTADSAERAYATYLRALDDISRLEICGHYVEGVGSSQVVHIFARTRAKPHAYFYRRWVGAARFTPWEAVDLNIEGSHLIPVVYNRRLWLIWPVFEDRVIEPASVEDSSKPSKYHRIRLSWSQYRDGRWASSKTSNTFVETRGNKPFRHDLKRRYYFWAEVREDALCVHLFHMNVIVDEWEDIEDHFGPSIHWSFPSSYDLNPEQPNQIFCFEGCQEDPRVYSDTTSGGWGWHVRRAIPYRAPNFAEARFMKTRQNENLTMFSKIVTDTMGRIIEDNSKQDVILRAKDTDSFDITPPHQYMRFFSQAPFFVEHRDRSFFVVPHDVPVDGSGPGETLLMMGKGALDINVIANLAEAYRPAVPAREMPDRLVVSGADTGGSPLVYTASSSTLVIDRTAPITSPAFFDAQYFEASDVEPQTAAFPAIGEFNYTGNPVKKEYEFKSFYHPYTCLFIEMLNRYGVEGLLAPERSGKGRELHRQMTPGSPFKFSATYGPTSAVALHSPFGSPREEIDFSYGGAYSLYNWELFFHIPMMIADRLAQNQKFEEARHWMHFVFDPTETDDEGLADNERFRRYWKIKPFFNASSRDNVEQILKLINQGDPDFENQVEEWEKDPFDVHKVASMRPVAYMKYVVMKYLDILIAEADRAFARDTIETINEAAQLYVLAGRILGRKPEEVARRDADARTYEDLREDLDALSNSLVEIENTLQIQKAKNLQMNMALLDQGAAGAYKMLRQPAKMVALANRPSSAVSLLASSFSLVAPPGDEDPGDHPVLYFCAPRNDKLLGYWDTVADRLFKIRNCLNIEGIERTLALFEPPIDPALLVKAAAAGVDLSAALSALNAPRPHYRFGTILPTALEFCGEVRSLGSELLTALEKRDGEALALLRSRHETQMLKSVRQVRQIAIDEARSGIDALNARREAAQERANFYRRRIDVVEVEGRPGLLKEEVEYEQSLVDSAATQSIGQDFDRMANIAYLFPDMKFGLQGMSSPELTFTLGGSSFGKAFQAFSSFYRQKSSKSAHDAQMSQIKAGYRRRKEDWILAETTALQEVDEIDRQIATSEIRVAMTEAELQNHDRQIVHGNEADDFLRSKFSNEDRYAQLAQDISTVYFQAYQTAYDQARRAEQCFRFELGTENTSFIDFGYWDSLKKGLLAGEMLQKDLRRMQAAYLDQNRRELEVAQSFSLDQLDASALVELRETGTCQFEIPELALDLAYPRHYNRRIWSVSVVFACLTGPHTNVNATLSLLSSRVRVSTDRPDGYAYQGINDNRFRHDPVSVQSIATSSANDDTGLLAFDFRDERYLPFEGAGAISTWQLSLPETLRSFDYNSISTVVLKLSYKARDGGQGFGGDVETHVADAMNDWLDELNATGQGLLRLFDLRSEFSDALHRFLSTGANGGQMALNVGPAHFPYHLRGHPITVTRIVMVLRPRVHATLDLAGVDVVFRGQSGSPTEFHGLSGFDWVDIDETIGSDMEPWSFELLSGVLDREVVEDIHLLVHYTVG